MNKLALLLIASMIASNSFAFPFHKKHQKTQPLNPTMRPAELSDFSGVWEGECTGYEGDTDEENDDEPYRLAITQNTKQISLSFGREEDVDGITTLVLNLNQLSSQSTSTEDKRDLAVQQVSPYTDMIYIDYEYMGEEIVQGMGKNFLATWLHAYLIKNGDTLEMRDVRTGEACTFKKVG